MVNFTSTPCSIRYGNALTRLYIAPNFLSSNLRIDKILNCIPLYGFTCAGAPSIEMQQGKIQYKEDGIKQVKYKLISEEKLTPWAKMINIEL